MKIRFFHPWSVSLLMIISHATFAALGEDSTPSHTCKVGGAIVSKFEHATETGTSRFSASSSRVDITGDINGTYGYRVLVTLNDEGQFRILNLSGTLNPVKGLSFTMGHTFIPLFNGHVISPSQKMFVNRVFITQYFLGSRDLGLLTKYNFHLGTVPTQLEFGFYNGNSIINPLWKKKMSYGGRIIVGDMTGARVSAKIYNYPNNETTHYLFYGADLRYKGENWKMETEVMKRESKTEFQTDLLAYYIQGVYALPIKTKLFDNLQPALRWDAISDTQGNDGFDVERLTIGVSFGSKRDQFSSILRVNYEWYFVTNSLPIFKNREMESDKISMEMLFTF